jgi:ribulose-bisphosphate carboxylase small chain
LFDLAPGDAHLAMRELAACRERFPEHYIKLIAYDASYGRQTTALSFIVNRPSNEPGFRLERADRDDRVMSYRLHSYATDAPGGQRYRNGGAEG